LAVAHPAIRFAQDLSPDQVTEVLSSAKVRRWLDAIQAAFDVRAATFARVYLFGKTVGFVLAEAEAYTREGARIPGIVFLRGDAVAIMLVLIASDGRRYTVLTRQPRLPVGHPSYEEIPAGMIDEDVVVAKALEELREEVGADLDVRAEDLNLLETIHSSPGGTDEMVQIFYAEKDVPDHLIRSLMGRKTGNPDEKEGITVEVIPLEDLAFRATSDMKTRMAYYSYMARQGIVAKPTRRGTSAAERR
jgi:ADP-sugar diphosphatase